MLVWTVLLWATVILQKELTVFSPPVWCSDKSTIINLLIKWHYGKRCVLWRCVCYVRCIAYLTLIRTRTFNISSLLLHQGRMSIFIDRNILYDPILPKIFISSHHRFIGQWRTKVYHVHRRFLNNPYLTMLDSFYQRSRIYALRMNQARWDLTWNGEATLRAALVQNLGWRKSVFLGVGSSKVLVLNLVSFHDVLCLTWAHWYSIHTFAVFWLRTIHLRKFTVVLQVLLDVQSVILLLILAYEIVLLLDCWSLTIKVCN